MRFVSRYIFLLVALLVTRAKGQLVIDESVAPTEPPREDACQVKHDDIMENLRIAFDLETNCRSYTYDNWDDSTGETIMSGGDGYYCSLYTASYEAFASYQYQNIYKDTIKEGHLPVFLTADYNHTSGASTDLSSTSTDFDSPMGRGCLTDFDHSIFQRMQALRLEYDTRLETCQDTHEDVLEQLHSSFGEENCIRAELEETTCNITLFGYTASAAYKYRLGVGLPLTLEVVSTYTEPDVPDNVAASNSIAQYADFSEVNNCLKDTNWILETVKRNRIKRDCSNSPDTIVYINPRNGKEKTTTCQAIGEGSVFKRDKLCQYDAVNQLCRGLCQTGQFCKCEDNPYEFRVTNRRNTTCTKLAEKSEATKTQKCQQYKFLTNCPGVCGCDATLITL